jgi:hypothetical protein
MHESVTEDQIASLFRMLNVAGLLLLLSTLLACDPSARKVTRVDPMIVLRHE